MLFVISWILLFALVSAFVSNPFKSEANAASGPNYWHVMFLHGLLISMVGLAALVACQALGVRSRHVRVAIAVGVLAATILTAFGGIWDKKVPGDEVPMWTQIAGFFALDEIFLALLVGIIGEWRRRARSQRTLPLLASGVATASMFAAALMGHLAGWMLEFGNSPGVIGRWERFVGEDRTAFTNNLTVSHSHEMVVATMALIVALAAQQFRYASLQGASRALARVGLGAIVLGTIGMSGIYIAAGFSTWEPPTWLTSHQGTNGLASDDIVTGVLVMGGGLLVLAAYALVGAGKLASLRRRPARVATLWAWSLSFATVVVAGYAIELDETYFGKGDPKAAGAAKDAVFTWIHQDIGLFLLPTLALVMLAVEHLIVRRRQGVIGLTSIAGMSIAFIGTVIFVFIEPAIHGAGYVVSTIGLAVIGSALLATIWYGTLGAGGQLSPADAVSPRPAVPSS